MLQTPRAVIQVADPAAADSRKLIEALDAYLVSLYPPESNHLLSVEELSRPHVTFLSARVDGQIAGCGAYVNHGDYAEIKRMFVLPELRGQQIGQRILAELESLASAAGLRVARLEAGVWQPAALRLYEQAGYQRRSRFGDYPEDPLSVFMEKRLS